MATDFGIWRQRHASICNDCADKTSGAPTNDKVIAQRSKARTRYREIENNESDLPPRRSGRHKPAPAGISGSRDARSNRTSQQWQTHCFSGFASVVMTLPTMVITGSSHRCRHDAIFNSIKIATLKSIKPALACLIFQNSRSRRSRSNGAAD